VLLTLAMQHKFKIHKLDFNTFKKYSCLDEDIYMNILEGFDIPSNLQLACKLIKILYELKQFSITSSTNILIIVCFLKVKQDSRI
jgi:hypothetical protein